MRKFFRNFQKIIQLKLWIHRKWYYLCYTKSKLIFMKEWDYNQFRSLNSFENEQYEDLGQNTIFDHVIRILREKSLASNKSLFKIKSKWTFQTFLNNTDLSNYSKKHPYNCPKNEVFQNLTRKSSKSKIRSKQINHKNFFQTW